MRKIDYPTFQFPLDHNQFLSKEPNVRTLCVNSEIECEVEKTIILCQIKATNE